MDDTSDPAPPSTKQEEWRSFLFLTAVMAPVVTIGVVAGWGFAVWIYQLITGDLPG
ncbi:nitrate reductase [Aquabacterium olei]|uniref:Nitrate reductase n=1 Tax=Aquabacterium olei TaxID=1296669 RepID=A0A2U8FRA8_9BURK|nr:periplasmic nitrate reductase, NapE protein [Aquabacterium olei]AWI53520.1 nitrate reductase [Aquabacterium olei]